MSLSAVWTDAIFDKLTLIYGRDFTGRWQGMDMVNVKTDWSHTLSSLGDKPDTIVWVLQNLPPDDKPPTVLQFLALAKSVPQAATVLPELPKADPIRKATELSKLSSIKDLTWLNDQLEWARIVVRRYEAGDHLSPFSVKLAKTALAERGLAA